MDVDRAAGPNGNSKGTESTDPAPAASVTSGAPKPNLPKGGGAIRGIGEKFATNPVTGSGTASVPIATSPGRAGFGPQLALSYDSGAGNGPFGFGWSLSLPSIARKTDKGLPQYLDSIESDVFIIAGAEDLVPLLVRDAHGEWAAENLPLRNVGGTDYRIQRYRPRIDALLARIERWTSTIDPADVFWRSIARDNVTTWYGRTPNSRVCDPADARRIFSWLVCESHDEKGNAMSFVYKAEDSARIFEDSAGRHVSRPQELNRTDSVRSAQRYLKRVRYGNRLPFIPELRADAPWPQPVDSWMFELVFDYGEHDTRRPGPRDAGTWAVRPDPFSSFRATFEVRTYRLCRRVLMFHHFPAEADVGEDCLVRSTDFTYAHTSNPADPRNPVYAFLDSVSHAGYWRADGGYRRRAMPPVAFKYSQPVVQDRVEEVDPASLENLPVGLDGDRYRWIDLHGEGVSGILSEQSGAWRYKRNLSPLHATARFAPQEVVALTPNVALGAGAQVMDLAGDGQPDVVVMDGPLPGFYEHDDVEGWETFRAFTARLNRDSQDPNLRFVDLDGDGRDDVLITEDEAIVWHVSLGEEGFGAAHRLAQALDEEKGPRVVFADVTESIFLADLSGDGLADLVRIRNGDVCYWPNMGYGRFGAKVAMGQAPWFDEPDQFDHRRLRLADIDGSGTTDIIYLHRDGVRLYFNESGNAWSLPHELKACPRVDDRVTILPVDLLGSGTSCLVWSSALPGDSSRPMRFINLMEQGKPHLLVEITNNLGASTLVTYAPSTRFYLRDKTDGRPWLTRLPFPVQVVERVEVWDRTSRNRFVSRYAYHHGHFDGEEREFRGFGMVEQWDTELATGLAAPVADNDAMASRVPQVHTKTWFHTGVCLNRDGMSEELAGLLGAPARGEYFREPGLTADEARSMLLADTVLPAGLGASDEREACRALKGSMLRQEVYALDDELTSAVGHVSRAGFPYSVVEQNFTVRCLQSRSAQRHGVFISHASESIRYDYERNPLDPRIKHVLTLEVDDFANVLKQATVACGRRPQIRSIDVQGRGTLIPNPGLDALQPDDRARQLTPLITYVESRFSQPVTLRDSYRTPLPCEVVTFELTGYVPGGSSRRFQAADLVEQDPANPGGLRHRYATPEVPYEEVPVGSRRRRRVEWLRTLYRSDDTAGPMPPGPLQLLALGELRSLALPGENYRLAFTPGLIDQVFQRPRDAQPPEALLADPASVLGGQGGDRGGYLRSQELKADGRFPASDPDDFWWIPSGQVSFSDNPVAPAAAELAQARLHFFTARRHIDPFGHYALVDFDAYDLLMARTTDALGNSLAVDLFDYRVLQPRRVRDPNGNRTEVAFDLLGLVVGTAVMGKDQSFPAEGDNLEWFVAEPDPQQIEQFLSKPRQASGDPGQSEPAAIAHDLLLDATTRFIYDVDRFHIRGEPPVAATIVREIHATDLAPGQRSPLQISFAYSDGFGREIQKKIQAEPGRVPQRDANGRIVVGPDGQPDMTSRDMSPRWIGSGWTVYNNKGQPARQYEPFFSDTHRFDDDARIGVTPILFYDPLQRVVARLHPNHCYEKFLFDPWQRTTHDVNDTCAARNQQTGDPRSDPDIHGYVWRYFEQLQAESAQPWQTWLVQRIGGARGQEEQTAAQRAAAHADTPTTVHLDALGRSFLTVARNRVACAGHDLDGTEGSLATRVELDIEGNERVIRDADEQPVDLLGRVVMRHTYDMLGHRIRHDSMEAGSRWMLADVAGKPIRSWDSRGHAFTTVYDALRRPVKQYVLGTFSHPDALKPNSDPRTLNPPGPQGLLVDQIVYGEPPPGATAAEEAEVQRLNLRTRIYRHQDCAGEAISAHINPVTGRPDIAYDFKGNGLRSTRRLASDYASIPDWSRNPLLDDEVFLAGTRYDALNRSIQVIAPHSSVVLHEHKSRVNVIQPVFNEANLLERLDVWLERDAEPDRMIDPAAESPSSVGVSDIDYDAKGQRTRIDYKTRDATILRTDYAYDAETFRLVHLYTRRGVDPRTDDGVSFDEDCDNPAPPPATIPAPDRPQAGRPCGLQNLRYTYDPAGNITHIRDDAQQTLYFRNQRVEPSNDYVYDALYRLIQADGREHLGQLAGGERMPPTAFDAFNAFHIKRDQPNDLKAMGRYVERFVYDAVGNVLSMQHRGTEPWHQGWSRNYIYAEPSANELGKRNNRLSRTTVNAAGNAPQVEAFGHDVHGNMVAMPHLTRCDWDYRDRLRITARQIVNDAPPPPTLEPATYYVYDAAGQRVRKVTVKSAGWTEERIYLGGFEIFRRHGGAIGPGTAKLERQTLHVMDDRRRIAVVEIRALDAAGNDPAPARQIRYQHGNRVGSAVLETDDRQKLLSYEEYSAYGSSTYQAVSSQTDLPKRYRYSGKERDEESGLYYHGARYYAPWLGRWCSCDPGGLVDGPNLFRAFRDNPVVFTDDDGKFPTADEMADMWEAHETQRRPDGSGEQQVARRAAYIERAANWLVDNTPGNEMQRTQAVGVITTLKVGADVVNGLVGTLDDPAMAVRGVMRMGRGTGEGVVDWEHGNKLVGGSKIVAEVLTAATIVLGGVGLSRAALMPKNPNLSGGLSNPLNKAYYSEFESAAAQATEGPFNSGATQVSVQPLVEAPPGQIGPQVLPARYRVVNGQRQVVTSGGRPLRVIVDKVRKPILSEVELEEAKSTTTAPLSENQEIGYPLIERNGGIVRGTKGAAIGLEAGSFIGPTGINIIRPIQLLGRLLRPVGASSLGTAVPNVVRDAQQRKQ